MRPRIEGSIGDDAMEDCGFLKFTDDEMKASFLKNLQTMRKHRLFCDVVLNVGNTDIHTHKNVLACISPYFMELFSAEQDLKNGHGEDIPSFRLNGGISKEALQILVDYAYTAQLEVPDFLVKDVYLTAWKLRVDRVVKQCARHLVQELCPDTCIEIRSLPGIDKNTNFVTEVNTFINNQFTNVSETAAFLQLSCVQIDVLYQTKQEMTLVTHGSLCRLVLDWIKRQLTDENISENNLLERSHLLYLALDNSLQDVSDLPGHESESELVQDYKRMVLKCPNNKQRRKQLAVPGRPRVLIYSRDIGKEEETESETDWNLISSTKCGENAFVALATINGNLMRMSVKLRLNNVPASPLNGSESYCPLSSTSSTIGSGGPGSIASGKQTPVDDKLELFCEVAAMSGPKCSLGVADLNGKLLVCGGYDRGECLKKVESYCPETNMWHDESNMLEARGRMQIAVLNGDVYAVAGSNGVTELDSVERLKPGKNKWEKCQKLPLARSNAGTCAVNGKIYCIGGWNGQVGIKDNHVFYPEENRWEAIAPLAVGRYQVGITKWKEKYIVAVGGSDAWNCLASIEIYDTEQNTWSFGPQLLTARRGCGVAEFQNKLWVVGGSDGTQSLSTTEIYDEETKVWIHGPPLNTSRSNVAVVVVNNKLYAIGGFSGKTFLNTMEYLDPISNEWTCFMEQQKDDEQIAEKVSKVLLAQSSLNEGYNNVFDKKSKTLETLEEVQKIISDSIRVTGNKLNGDDYKNGIENDENNSKKLNDNENIINGSNYQEN